jgi:hypothetical protein
VNTRVLADTCDVRFWHLADIVASRYICSHDQRPWAIVQMSQQGQWQVAGSAPEVYERELVPAVFGPWAPIVVELAHPSPGERVVDVACGTGIVARIAAARVGPSASAFWGKSGYSVPRHQCLFLTQSGQVPTNDLWAAH